MNTLAVIMEKPNHLLLERIGLDAPGPADVVVETQWSGVSAGTERLLWSGRMPDFPGMGYPLVPGYESAGRVVEAGRDSGRHVGETVFVPGARCFGEVKGLFGGAASRLVTPGARALPIDAGFGEAGALLALAATAFHVTAAPGAQHPDLIVGHGVLGRLIARLAMAAGAEPPVVWETSAARRDGAEGYSVIDPAIDEKRDYHVICDASGDGALLDTLMRRLAPSGEIVLAGFYSAPLTFAFPPAFMREARLRVASQWRPADLAAVRGLVEDGRLSLGGLATHHAAASDAPAAYERAFTDPACLKMILDWRACV